MLLAYPAKYEDNEKSEWGVPQGILLSARVQAGMKQVPYTGFLFLTGTPPKNSKYKNVNLG